MDAPAPAGSTCETGYNFGGVGLIPPEEVPPVPEAALACPLPEEGYILDVVQEGVVYTLTDNTYVHMFAVTDEGVVLFLSLIHI